MDFKCNIEPQLHRLRTNTYVSCSQTDWQKQLARTPQFASVEPECYRQSAWQLLILANEFKRLRILLLDIVLLAPVLLNRDWEVEKHLANPKPT